MPRAAPFSHSSVISCYCTNSHAGWDSRTAWKQQGSGSVEAPYQPDVLLAVSAFRTLCLHYACGRFSVACVRHHRWLCVGMVRLRCSKHGRGGVHLSLVLPLTHSSHPPGQTYEGPHISGGPVPVHTRHTEALSLTELTTHEIERARFAHDLDPCLALWIELQSVSDVR